MVISVPFPSYVCALDPIYCDHDLSVRVHFCHVNDVYDYDHESYDHVCDHEHVHLHAYVNGDHHV